MQDEGEVNFTGVVTVKLYSGSFADPAPQTQNTSTGNYLFENLAAGTYCVEFSIPSGYTVSPQDQGGNDALDSDGNGPTGRTTLKAGQPLVVSMLALMARSPGATVAGGHPPVLEVAA